MSYWMSWNKFDLKTSYKKEREGNKIKRESNPKLKRRNKWETSMLEIRTEEIDNELD